MSLLCRICACPSDLHIPIFSGEGAENDLLNKIHKHLPIQVSEDDKLPNEVCFECASTVCTWHDLVSKCVEADIKLRAMQNTESIKTDDDASRSSGTDDVEVSEPHSEAEDTVRVKLLSLPSAQEMKPPKLKKRNQNPPAAAKPVRCLARVTEEGSKMSMKTVKEDEPLSLGGKEPSAQRFLIEPQCQPITQDPGGLSLNTESKSVLPKATIRKVVWLCSPSPLHRRDSVAQSVVVIPAITSEGVPMSSVESNLESNKHVPSQSLKTESETSKPICKSKYYTSEEKCVISEERTKERFFCGICEQLFISRTHLSKHNMDVHQDKKKSKRKAEKVYVCGLCPRGFTRQHDMHRHIKTIHSLRPSASVPKDICSVESTVEVETTPLQECLSEPETVVEKDKPADSPECVSELDSSKKDTSSVSYLFVCEVCPRKFSRRINLDRHREMHLGMRPHSCEYCGQKFASKQGRDNHHRRKHTKEVMSVCETCGVPIGSSSMLYYHRKIHSQNTPYECPFCGKKFAIRAYANRHIRFHTGEKSHLCSICGKGFPTSGQLQRHEVAHSDQRPFSCNICGLKYKAKKYLSRHTLRHHPS